MVKIEIRNGKLLTSEFGWGWGLEFHTVTRGYLLVSRTGESSIVDPDESIKMVVSNHDNGTSKWYCRFNVLANIGDNSSSSISYHLIPDEVMDQIGSIEDFDQIYRLLANLKWDKRSDFHEV